MEIGFFGKGLLFMGDGKGMERETILTIFIFCFEQMLGLNSTFLVHMSKL